MSIAVCVYAFVAHGRVNVAVHFVTIFGCPWVIVFLAGMLKCHRESNPTGLVRIGIGKCPFP